MDSVFAPMLGKIGKIRVNAPFTHHNASFECAAWWEDSEAIPGVYDLSLISPYMGDLPRVSARIDAKVIDDYFPTLFAGVSTGKPTFARHIGESRVLVQSFDLLDAIERTGNSQNVNGNDFYIEPALIPALIVRAKIALRHAILQQQEHGLDGEYNMIAFYAERIATIARFIEKAQRAHDWRMEHPQYDKNFDWAV